MRQTSVRRAPQRGGRAVNGLDVGKGRSRVARNQDLPLAPHQLRCPVCGRGVGVLEALTPSRPYPVLRGHCSSNNGRKGGPSINCPGSQMPLAYRVEEKP